MDQDLEKEEEGVVVGETNPSNKPSTYETKVKSLSGVVSHLWENTANLYLSPLRRSI